jgi:succinate-acetate transporter protein
MLPEAAIGLFLLGWTIFTALLTIGAFRINGALALTFTVLLLTFIALIRFPAISCAP